MSTAAQSSIHCQGAQQGPQVISAVWLWAGEPRAFQISKVWFPGVLTSTY